MLGFSLGFLLLEGGLRIFNPMEFYVRGDRIILPANTSWEFRFDYYGLDPVVNVTRNELGLRGPSLNGVSDDALRIVTVGGSTTENLYHSDEKTWTGHLASLLSQHFAPIWVNNAGLDGHTTYGHLVLLRDYLTKLDLDIAIYLVGMNDVGVDTPIHFDKDFIDSGMDFSSFRQFVRTASRYSEVVALALNLYRAYRAHITGLTRPVYMWDFEREDTPNHVMSPDVAKKRFDELTGPYLQGYADRLRKIIEFSRQSGIEPVLVTQPAVFGPVIDDYTGWDLGKISSPWGLSGIVMWQVLERYNDVTRAIAAEEDVLLIDLAIRMPKTIRFYYDSIHYTYAGTAEVGRIIFTKLCHKLERDFPQQLAKPCPPAEQRLSRGSPGAFR